MPHAPGESAQEALRGSQPALSGGQKHEREGSSLLSPLSSFPFPREETKTPPGPRRSASSPRCAGAGTHPAGSKAAAFANGESSDNRNGRETANSSADCSTVGVGTVPATSNMTTSRFADFASSLQMCRSGNSGSTSPSLYSTIIKEKRSRITFTNFYKTKLCPWYLKGNCHWGATCNYAHTLSEQREAVDLTKTKLCSTWLRHGACHNQKCRFAHDYSELRATTDVFKTALCSFYIRKIPCPMEASCRFAHGVHELRPRGGSVPDTHANGSFTTLQDLRSITSQEQQHKSFQPRLQPPEEHHRVNRESHQPHQPQAKQQQQQLHHQRHLSGVMAAEARLAAAAAAAAGAAARAAAAAKAATEAKAAAAAAAAAAGMASTYDSFSFGMEGCKARKDLESPPPGFSPIARALQGQRAGAAAILRALAYETQQHAMEEKKKMKDTILERTLGTPCDTSRLPPPHATGILTLDKATGTWQPAVPSPAYRPPAAPASTTGTIKDVAAMVQTESRPPGNKRPGVTPSYPLDSLESTFDALLQALQQQGQQKQQKRKPACDNWPPPPATVSPGLTEDVGKAFTMMDFTKLLSTVAMAIAAAPVTSSEPQQHTHEHVAIPGAAAAAAQVSVETIAGGRQPKGFAAGPKYTVYAPPTTSDNNAGGLAQSSWAFPCATYGTMETQAGEPVQQTATAQLAATPAGGTVSDIGGAGAIPGARLPVAVRSVRTTEGLLLSAGPLDGEEAVEIGRSKNANSEHGPWSTAASSCSFAATTPALSAAGSKCPPPPPLSVEGCSALDSVATSQSAIAFLSQSCVSLLKDCKYDDKHGGTSPKNAVEGGLLKPSNSPESAFLLQGCENVACSSPTAIPTTADRLDAAGTLLVGGASPAAGSAGAAAAAVEGYLSPAASNKSGHGVKPNAEETQKKGGDQPRRDETGSRQSTTLGIDSE